MKKIYLVAAVILILGMASLAWALSETQYQPPDRKLQGFAQFFSAKAANGTSEVLEITGYDQGTIAVKISGTATVTPQLSQDGTNYFDLAYITATSFVNYEGVFRYARVVVSGCSGCSVDATWMGDNK